MSEAIKVKVHIEMSGIEDHFEDLRHDDTLMLQLHNILFTKCNPYVPFLEGYLSHNVEVTPEHVLYIQPYAHYQYHGVNFNHTLTWHPLASALWDEAMLSDKREEFEAEVEEAVRRRYKELYG